MEVEILLEVEDVLIELDVDEVDIDVLILVL